MAGHRKAVYICGPGSTPAPRPGCGNSLHDARLPADYLGASEQAGEWLNAGWKNLQCPDCGLFGWEAPRGSQQ